MHVNNRAIAIALATIGVVGLAAVPTLGQRAASSTSKGKSDAAMRSPAKNTQFKTGQGALNARQSPHRQTIPGDGGIAGATTSYSTSFEAPFTPGNINGQQGWIVFPGTTTGSTISNTAPLQGAQSLQLADDAAITSGNFSGAETPTTVTGPGRHTVTFTANISATGGADYVVDAISNTDALVVGKMYFFFADVATGGNVQGDPDSEVGDILVLDDIGAGLQFVATGREYTPGAATVYRMEINNDANRVKYFQGNDLIYVGDAISPTSGVEAVDFYSDNFQNPGETGKFDVLSVEQANGLCNADVVRNNAVDVNDLLAVVNFWGPCAALPSDCAADFVVNNNVDVNDLLGVINAWGPCLVPTGACCTLTGTCNGAQAYAACIGAGGAYQGNGVTCGSVTCPAANNECAGAAPITLPFSASVDPGDYTPNDATDPDTTCEIAGGGPYIKAGGWWYTYTAPANGTLSVQTCDNGTDTGDNDAVVSVYTGSCGTGPTAGWTQIACDDDGCNDPNPPGDPGYGASTLSVAVTAGTTYLIFIDHYEYTGGVNGNTPVSITGP